MFHLIICPPLAVTLTNVYREADLLMVNVCCLKREPPRVILLLCLYMYALSTVPLIQRLEGIATQVWVADDAAGSH